MKRLILLIALIACMFPVITHAAIDPVDGIITHSFLDRESNVIVGVLAIQDRSNPRVYHLANVAIDGALATNGHVDVYNIAVGYGSGMIMQNNHELTYSLLDPNEYPATMANKHFHAEEDGSGCDIFTLHLADTNENVIVCISPASNAQNDDNIAVSFHDMHNMFYGGTIGGSNNVKYEFIVLNSDPGITYRTFIPVVFN